MIGPKRQLGAIEHDFVRGHRLASLASPGWSALSKPKLPGPNNLELDHPIKAGKANAKENQNWASPLGATSREPPACLGYIPSPRVNPGGSSRSKLIALAVVLWHTDFHCQACMQTCKVVLPQVWVGGDKNIGCFPCAKV